MNDEQLIDEGRKLVVRTERAQMRLGHLALAYAPIGQWGQDNGVFDRLQEYADAIGVPYTTIKVYRQIANAWHGYNTEGFGFSVLKAVSGAQSKKTLLDMMRKKPAPTRSGRWSPETAQALARKHGLWVPQERSAAEGAVVRRVVTLGLDLDRLSQRMRDQDFTREERIELEASLETIEHAIVTLRAALAELVPAE